MKTMDVSKEDDDCEVKVVIPMKKKKLKQAQLSFQTLNTSSDSTNIASSKKRKMTSPLIAPKSSKVSKFLKKDCIQSSLENKTENIRETKDSKECVVITEDNERKELEQSDQQGDEDKKNDVTPKKSSAGKNKKLDKSQQKSGALTKFLKKTDKKTESTTDNNDTHESKTEQDLQDTSIRKAEDEVCSNENLESSGRSNSQISQANEESKSLNVHDTKGSFFQQSDSNVVILSSDNESSNELDKSISNKNKETQESESSQETDKDAKKKLRTPTPKQLEKREEIVRRKEEKLKLKMEKEKKREEEKANRRREREEKQKEKEEKEKMEKEQKKKDKMLKELKKQMEIEQKQKDKEAKEEERRKREEAKEEEKKRKEEEKLEVERKKQKAASNFASFFVSKKHEAKQTEEENVIEAKNFMPFEIKTDMKIAPICRRTLSEREKLLLDEKCNTGIQRSELYLQDIRKNRIVPRTSLKTWPLEAKDDDVIPLDDDNDGSSNIIRDTHDLEKHRVKLLQFSENRRPPYWGTWRKRSKKLNSRRPFAKDGKWFDYEIDSDDEWEEEEPGESLKGSDDEKDEENPEENEYDVDNEFMVPHGYLSEEEAQADEEEMEDMSPQTQKMKLKILGEQFEAERNAKMHKLKPKIIGCIWEGAGNSFPEFVPAKIKEILLARRAWIRCIPIILPSSATEDDSTNTECKTSTQSTRGPRKTKFPDEALPDLIRLLHGNTYGRRFLMREFMVFWNKKNGGKLSKVSVLQTINNVAERIACPDKGPMHLKFCWYVAEETRKQHLPDDEELLLPNCWTYSLTPTRKSNLQDVTDKPEKEEPEKEKERKHVPLITQFAKKITQEEMKRQLTKPKEEEASKQPEPNQVASKLPAFQRPPKRAALVSIGRGEQFPEKHRVLDKFVGINKRQDQASTSNETDTDDDVVFVESIDVNAAKNPKSEAKDNKPIVQLNDHSKSSKNGSVNTTLMVVDD